jgi:hypothetical protein
MHRNHTESQPNESSKPKLVELLSNRNDIMSVTRPPFIVSFISKGYLSLLELESLLLTVRTKQKHHAGSTEIYFKNLSKSNGMVDGQDLPYPVPCFLVFPLVYSQQTFIYESNTFVCFLSSPSVKFSCDGGDDGGPLL